MYYQQYAMYEVSWCFITSDLSWNSHINTFLAKWNRMMGMIKRYIDHKPPIM